MATDVEAATAVTVVAKSLPNRRQFQDVFPSVITVQATFDEDSIAAAKASQGDYTVPGAALGDIVLVSAAIDPVYVLLSGKVKSAGVVTVTALNQDSTDASTTFSAAPTIYITVLSRNTSNFAAN